MKEYHKIQTCFKRDEKTKHILVPLQVGKWRICLFTHAGIAPSGIWHDGQRRSPLNVKRLPASSRKQIKK